MSDKKINSLDDIKAAQSYQMTPEIQRLFAYASCSPTICHACEKEIALGMNFRLLPHKDSFGDFNDEMVCASCGTAELNKRDRRIKRAQERKGGFSRPHRERGDE